MDINKEGYEKIVLIFEKFVVKFPKFHLRLPLSIVSIFEEFLIWNTRKDNRLHQLCFTFPLFVQSCVKQR